MPQFQIIILAIFSAAIFLCWLVFGNPAYNVGITPALALLFLLVSIGLLIWIFFTSSGSAFANKYNKLQQDRKEAELEIISLSENILKTSTYQTLMGNFSKLSTFSEVDKWDKLAELEIKKLVTSLEKIELKLENNQKIFNQSKISELRAKYINPLENIATKLQESIDFTPNSLQEKKVLLKELKQRKKELQLQKREITASMRTIQANARSRSTYAGRGFLGMYSSKLAAHERRRIRYDKEAALRPQEDLKAAIDRQILELDKDILWAEKFSD